MIRELLIAGVGGGIGSMARYLLQSWMLPYSKSFPAGTFLVNIIGCFAIGIIYGLTDRYNLFTFQQRLFLTTGLCGGFTTFSAFALENIVMLKNGNYFLFFLYAVASVLAGILFVLLGSVIIKY